MYHLSSTNEYVCSTSLVFSFPSSSSCILLFCRRVLFLFLKQRKMPRPSRTMTAIASTIAHHGVDAFFFSFKHCSGTLLSGNLEVWHRLWTHSQLPSNRLRFKDHSFLWLGLYYQFNHTHTTDWDLKISLFKNLWLGLYYQLNHMINALCGYP